MFAKGYMEAEGFEPSADLLAERENILIIFVTEDRELAKGTWEASETQPSVTT